MDLLTASDWGEIRSALQDVMDTFFKFPVVFVQRRTRKLTAFHENRNGDLQEAIYNWNALVVPENKDENKSQVDQYPKGFVDTSQGYLYFNYKWLKEQTPSFIFPSGRPNIVPNKDSFRFLGVEVTVIGVNLVGPTESDFQMVKVQYKNQIPNLNDLPGTTDQDGIFDDTFDESFQ